MCGEDKIEEKILELQKKIEKEKEEKFEDLLLVMCEEIDLKEEKDREAKHNLAILTWLCLKVNLECQVLENGNREIEEMLRNDIDEVFEYVKNRRYQRKVSEEVIADSIDLMLSIGTIKEEDLQRYGSRYVPESVRTQKEVSEDLYYLFIFVSGKLLAVGEKETAYRIVEQLCRLSRKRNGIERHKNLTVYAMGTIFDDASQVICRIAEIDETFFAGECSDYAADFYWIYANSLWKEENPDRAKIYFEICYSIRKELYGEEHWFTVLAKNNASIIEFTASKSMTARENLLEFITGVEENKYTDMKVYEEIQAETIWFLLMGQFDTALELPEYEELIGIYECLCDGWKGSSNEKISKRFVWNFRGNYYFQKGEYILAENAFQNALKEKENVLSVSILSDDQIKTNLLLVASVQNDFRAAENVFSELSDGSQLSDTDFFRLYAAIVANYFNYVQAGIALDEEEIWEIKDLAMEVCETILSEDSFLEGADTAAAIFLYCSVLFFLDHGYADKEEQELYLEVLKRIEKDVLKYQLLEQQKKLLVIVETLLAWNLRMPEAEHFMKKMLEESEEARIPVFLKAFVENLAAIFFGKRGEKNLAMEYAGNAMAYEMETWHGYVKYANDTRLYHILFPIQLRFFKCYTVVRRFADFKNAYERVLQFKMLASLAGRERNRVLHSAKMNSELVKEINTLQDRLAELATKEIFGEQILECEKLEEHLREREALFARTFPSETEFKEITWELVSEAVPDNSVVLEYHLAMDDFGYTQFETQPDYEKMALFELYFIKKQNGITSLKRLDIRNAESIQEKAEQFLSIYQEKSENSGISMNDSFLEDLRYDLYEALIRPVIDEIDENMTVYFAPDSTLINLPFELLYEDESLEETHEIIKIECARDFLFTSPEDLSDKQGLVIGNPEYFVKEKERKEEMEPSFEQTRAIDRDLMKVEQLPFAEMEAQRVAGYFSALPWIGKGATKEKMLTAGEYQNLHIATHGFFDLSGETDAIYSSCLLFAGVKNWMQNLVSSQDYGNGIVTADEISRLNLKSTKLVVLSSCLNGRSEGIISKGFQGMVGAFAAAGVKYVIAHLWNAPETIGTLILMDTFYSYYTKEKMEPPLALAKAKKYLKNLTIDQMREQGWFRFIKNSNLDFTSKKNVAVLEQYNGRVKPYKDEIFWGGFSCYRCN